MNARTLASRFETFRKPSTLLAAIAVGAAMLTVAAPRAEAQWNVGVAVGTPAYTYAPAPAPYYAPGYTYGYAPTYAGGYYDPRWQHERHEEWERERHWQHEQWEHERHWDHERWEHERHGW